MSAPQTSGNQADYVYGFDMLNYFLGADAYNDNNFVREAVDRLAYDMSDVDYEIWENGRLSEPRPGSFMPGIETVWARPNPFMSQQEMLLQAFIDFFIHGSMFLHVERSGFRPLVITRISPTRMTAEWEDERVVRWIRSREGIGGTMPFQMRYPVLPNGDSDIFKIGTYNPANRFEPNSLLQAVRLPVQCTNEALRYNRNAQANGMTAASIISVSSQGDNKVVKDSEQTKEFKNAVNRVLTDKRNAGRAMITYNKDIAVHDLGRSARDMQYEETLNFIARMINNIFGVPAQLIGVQTEANSYANYNNAVRAYYEGNVTPRVKHFSSELSRWLSIITRKDIEVRPNLNELPVYRDIRTKRIMDLEASGGKVATLEERRQLAGLPEATPEQIEELQPPIPAIPTDPIDGEGNDGVETGGDDS